MTRRILFGFCALLIMASAGGAQQQLPQGAWWEGQIARDLNLNEGQSRQIRRTVREYRHQLIDFRGNLQKAEGDFQDLMNDDPVDVRKANEAIDRMALARSELTKTLSQMSLKLRIILTPQQWRDLQHKRGGGK